MISYKKNNTLLNILPVTLVISCILAIITPNLSLLKDIVIILSVLYCFIIDTTFESRIFLYLFLVATLMIIFTIVVGNINTMSIINIRFVYIYPLLMHVGRLLSKRSIKLDYMFKFMNYYYLFVAIGGLIEFLNPSFFYQIVKFINPAHDINSLLRGGLGFGLGSWYGSRQLLAIDMCLALIIGYETIKRKNSKILIFSIYLFNIAMSLSRTGIITSIILIIFLGIMKLKNIINIKKLNLKSIIGTIVLLIALTLYICFSKDNIILAALDKMLFSLSKMDKTMSGRTDIIKEFLTLGIDIFPKFDALGNSKFASTNNSYGIGNTADNSFLRLFISYGSAFVIPYFIVCIRLIYKSIKYKDIMFVAVLILYFVAGITFDLYHMVTIIVPIWIIVGYKLEESR